MMRALCTRLHAVWLLSGHRDFTSPGSVVVDVIAGGMNRVAAVSTLVMAILFTTGCVDLIKTEGPIGEPQNLASKGTPEIDRQMWGVPITTNDGQAILIQAMAYRHQGEEARPLVIVNHGDPANSNKRRRWYGGDTLAWAAHWFAKQGYNVVVPLRAGFGRSQGSGQLKHNVCLTMNYTRTGNYVGDEILKVLAFFRQQDWVDPDHVILVGQSWGGTGVIAAAARQPKGVRAIIDFAGVTAKNTRTRTLCAQKNAYQAFKGFAKRTLVPALWVFSENDTFNDEEEVHSIFNVYESKSQAASELAMLPPFAENGHSVIYRKEGLSLWTPVVKKFLKAHVPYDRDDKTD